MSGFKNIQQKIRFEVSELASSLKEIVDKFHQLQNPIIESHGKVPKATEQLDKINEQTEAATHKMLDTIERIIEREQCVISGLKEIVESSEIKKYNKVIKTITGIQKKSEENCNDAYAIMDALQFQDITAQQMNHAATLLEDIEVKLFEIVKVLDGKEEDAEELKPRKDRAYDPHADVFESKTNQKDIDSIFEKNSK